jgi:hypothetical protein
MFISPCSIFCIVVSQNFTLYRARASTARVDSNFRDMEFTLQMLKTKFHKILIFYKVSISVNKMLALVF